MYFSGNYKQTATYPWPVSKFKFELASYRVEDEHEDLLQLCNWQTRSQAVQMLL